MRKRIFLVLMTILAAPLASPADDEGLFATLDADKDGFVTKDEVPEDRRRLFERLVRSNDKDSST